MVLNATPIEIKQCIRAGPKMLIEMVSSQIFQREYLFIRNWPYDEIDRALFIRRSFWENHPRKDELDCIPVADTGLGMGAETP